MYAPDRFRLFSEDEARVGVIIGTGPSLNDEQLEIVYRARREKQCRLFGVNNAYKLDLDVHLACNWQWWDEYWDDVKAWPCHKWTPRKESANKYGINYIEERWEDGLSTDPNYICAHHGSGPQSVNLALHYGCEKMLLIGWDMRYPGKVNRRNYTQKRHYFGEYPANLQHWPKTGDNGELDGLIREMATIEPKKYNVEIINCTPGSAMTCFPMGTLADHL